MCNKHHLVSISYNIVNKSPCCDLSTLHSVSVTSRHHHQKKKNNSGWLIAGYVILWWNVMRIWKLCSEFMGSHKNMALLNSICFFGSLVVRGNCNNQTRNGVMDSAISLLIIVCWHSLSTQCFLLNFITYLICIIVVERKNKQPKKKWTRNFVWQSNEYGSDSVYWKKNTLF